LGSRRMTTRRIDWWLVLVAITAAITAWVMLH
jgi:hypothetical protein